MIPLRDNIPSRKTPWINYTLIAINIAVFFWELTLSAYQFQAVSLELGVVPARFFAPRLLEPSTHPLFTPFLTSLFLHAGWMHLLGNMLFLYIFGDNVEDAMGSLNYILFYFLAGTAAAILQSAAHPFSTLPMIGASGAISGILGAYIRLYPRARILSLLPIFFFIQLIEIPAIIFIGFWFLIQLFNGAASFSTPGGVAWWAHIGGFLAGFGCVQYFTTYSRRR